MEAGVASPSTTHEPPPKRPTPGPASRQASTSADYKCSSSEGLLNRLQLTIDSRSSRSVAYKFWRLQAPVLHQGRHPFLSLSSSASRHLGLKTSLKSALAVVYPAQQSGSLIETYNFNSRLQQIKVKLAYLQVTIMALPPIVTATLQSAALSGTSNILAQVLTAYQTDKQLVIDWVPVFHFIIFTLLSTPPNFLWQGFLEESFPAYHVSPTKKAIASAAANDDKALDREAREDQLVEPKLNIRNTLVKLILDQTVGASLNTLAFSMFMHSIQTAMVRPEHLAAAQHSGTFLFSRGAIDYSNVDWRSVVHKSQLEFVPIFIAGLKLWPMVSLVNFAFIKSIEGRNLVGSLAGVAWGIYMSLVAAR